MGLKKIVLMYLAEKRAYEEKINTVRLRMAAHDTTSTLLYQDIRRLEHLLNCIVYFQRGMQSALLNLMNSGISHRRFLQFVKEVERGE